MGESQKSRMNWKEKGAELKRVLSLKTEPIGVKRVEKISDLDAMPNVVRWDQGATFCQMPYIARAVGMTIAITSEGGAFDRCKRLHGLLPVTDESMKEGAEMLATTWMPNVEEAMQQQRDYPRIKVKEATVLGPLSDDIEPDAVVVFGNPAQLMMLMCGMQKIKYECFEFQFVGEGACTDSLTKCLATGKASLAIPCYGERAFGQVSDDELVIALPREDLDRALEGLAILGQVGMNYPILQIGGTSDPMPILKTVYPDAR